MSDESANVTRREFQTIMDEITDFEDDCAACDVSPRTPDSRYCETCHEALVEGR
jgi:hypothetical protein